MGQERINIILGRILLFVFVSSSVSVSVAAEGRDPTKETVLIGVNEAGGMMIKLEIEPAQSMFMQMHGTWTEMKPSKGEIHHFEVKPEDPGSKTRLPYASVKFRAVNTTTGKAVENELHPMWGGSGLHYAANGALPGDGVYVAEVTVGPPTFARGPKNKETWRKPVRTEFRFNMKKGQIIP